MNRLLTLRHLVHALIFVGIGLAAVLKVPFAGCAYLKIGLLRLVCPVGFLETALASHSVPWQLVPGFVFICVLIFVVGRAYCSWACPASFLGTQMQKLSVRVLPKSFTKPFSKKFRKAQRAVSARLGTGKGDAFALLAGLALGIVLFGYPAWSIICPVGLVSRGLIEGIVHHVVRWDLVLLLLPILISLCFRSGWKCACPVGTVRGLLATPNRTLTPLPDASACRNCSKCARVCPAGLDPIRETDPQLCTKCLQCVDACPFDVLSLALLRSKKGNAPHV